MIFRQMLPIQSLVSTQTQTLTSFSVSWVRTINWSNPKPVRPYGENKTGILPPQKKINTLYKNCTSKMFFKESALSSHYASNELHFWLITDITGCHSLSL